MSSALDALFDEWGVNQPPPQPAQPTTAQQIAASKAKKAKAKATQGSAALDQLFTEWEASAPKVNTEALEAEKRKDLQAGSAKYPTKGGAPLAVRLQAGVKKTELGTYNNLVSQLGEENVLPIIGNDNQSVVGFRVRRSKDEPWRELDPSPDRTAPGGRIGSAIADLPGDIADAALPFVLEAAPGAAGSAAGTALAGPIGGIAGGAAGDVAGTYLRDAVSRRFPGEESAQLDTERDAMINAGAGMVLSAAPVVGRFVKPSVRSLAAKAGKELVLDEGAERVATRTGADIVKDRMALSARTGVDFTPGQATGSRHLLQLQDAASSVGKYADKVRGVEVNQARQWNAFLGRALDRVGSDVDAATAGKAVSGAYSRYLDALADQRRAATKPLFDEAERALGGQRAIPVNGFLDAVDDMIARYASPGSSSGTQALVRQLEGIKKNLVADGGQRGGVSVSELSAMLSDWGASAKPGTAEVFKDTDPRRARAVAARLFGALKGDMAAAADDQALGPAAGALRRARDTYAELSKPIDEARSALLQKALKIEGETPDIIGREFIQSRSHVQIKKAIDIVAKADPEAAIMLKRDMLNALVEGAEAGAESTRSLIDTSPQKFASQMSKSKNRSKVLAILGSGGDGAEAMRMWNDAIEAAAVISDRGLPPGSPTASRLMNAAEAMSDRGVQAGGAAAGAALFGPVGAAAGSALATAATKGRAFLNSKMLADLAADPIKRDEFYALIAKQGRGLSGAGKAWAGARALIQLGVVEMRDAAMGGASYDDIQQTRQQRVAPGAVIAAE